MKLIRCDRCGKEIPRGETSWIIQANPTDPLGKPMFTEPTGNDLCNDCGKELGEWLHPNPREKRARALYNIMIGKGLDPISEVEYRMRLTEEEKNREKHTSEG